MGSGGWKRQSQQSDRDIGEEEETRMKAKLKYYDIRKYEMEGINIDLEGDILDKDDNEGANERQKLIFLLKKREKKMEKKLGQLNQDVNYLLKSNLGKFEHKRKSGAIPLKRNTSRKRKQRKKSYDSEQKSIKSNKSNDEQKEELKIEEMENEVLLAEEENLIKRLINYETDINNKKDQIDATKEKMMQKKNNKKDNRTISAHKKNLEDELKDIKIRLIMAKGNDVLSPDKENAKHHANYNNSYIFNYRNDPQNEDIDNDFQNEGENSDWTGKVSKDFHGERKRGNLLKKRKTVMKKEKRDIEKRIKKEIEIFEKKEEKVSQQPNKNKGGFSYTLVICLSGLIKSDYRT